MNTNANDAAQRYYDACFGPDADELTAEDVLAVEQLTHSLRGTCRWELLLAGGGPAARVVVDLDNDEPCAASFEFQDWGIPWTPAAAQDRADLLRWACENFYLACPYCEHDRQA